MDGTIDDRYLEWLYERFASVTNKNPARSYWKLARALYSKEFSWTISNDDNRIADGRDLRREFLDERGSDGVSSEWMTLGCSMLEMLVALARRAAFESDIPEGDWFWIFMRNLELSDLSDKNYGRGSDHVVEDALDRVIFRTYDPDGHGGLFPLRNPSKDQRKVELWYQLAEYLMENDPP